MWLGCVFELPFPDTRMKMRLGTHDGEVDLGEGREAESSRAPVSEKEGTE